MLDALGVIRADPRASLARAPLEVIELGAGIGSVSARVPAAVPLRLVELDPRLCRVLRARLSRRPRTRVTCGDAFAVLDRALSSRARASHADRPAGRPELRILANLPFDLTDRLLDALACAPRGSYGRAVVAVAASDRADDRGGRLVVEPVCDLPGACFRPRQPFDSRAVLVRPRRPPER